MSGALKLAWGLTAFVVVAGVVLWVVTGKAVFVAFIVLGALTAVGALVTGRAERKAAGNSAAGNSAAGISAAGNSAAGNQASGEAATEREVR